MMTTQINAKRLEQHILELARIGETPEQGVSRFALTGEDRAAQDLVTTWMQAAGMTVRRDHFGNLIGHKQGKDPTAPVVMLGSHIDTVPNGGRYDGTIGVLGAIEVVQTIHERGSEHDCSIEVVAFCDEEGTRFPGGLFGSRGMVGQLNWDEFHITDAEGITRLEALRSFGLEPERYRESVRGPGEIKVYLEMHIEQGPALEVGNHPVGIVKGIAGPLALQVRIDGEAGHAGTVPMKMRKDPMVAASEVILSIEQLCSEDPDAATVGTVGWIKAEPGGPNVIPQAVEFSVDIRDIDRDRRERVVSQLKAHIAETCERRHLQYRVDEHLNLAPTLCAEHVTETMASISKAMELEAPLLVSGAAHDAMSLADITDIGMIFVRCRGGISHNPLEWASIEDIQLGTQLLLATVLHYSRKQKEQTDQFGQCAGSSCS